MTIITNEPPKKPVEVVEKQMTEVLHSVSAVFPFDLFPNKLVIYRNRVDFIYNHFFFVQEILPIHLQNIISASVSINIVFATFELEVSGLPRTREAYPSAIGWLPIGQTKRALQIVTGLVAARDENLATDHLSTQELLDYLEKMGDNPLATNDLT